MSARKSSSAKRLALVGAALLPALALGACADYLKHSDTITSAAGDAQAHNKVVHIADPWPPAAAHTRITGNGPRVDRVTKRYLTGGSASSAASAPAGNASSASNSPNPQNAQPSQ
jgi:hypothetical protein